MTRDIIVFCITVIIIQFLIQKIYDIGFITGNIAANGKLYAIKNRTVTRGNILEYTGRNWCRETPKTSDSDSPAQGENPPEKET